MLASTQWVWSCGSPMRLARCRNPATIIPCAATRGRCRVIGSQPLVCSKPGDIVGPAIFLASDLAGYVTGGIVMADGGYRAL